MILLKIWLILLLISFYSWFVSIQDDQKDEQYKEFFEVFRIIFLISFGLNLPIGIYCIIHYIK